MRILLLGVLLVFLTQGHSMPVNDVTEIPAKTEADVLREAITDGFIVDQPFFPSVIDESPRHNVTGHADVVVQLPDTLRPTSDPEEESTRPTPDEADMMEASAPVEGSADYPMSEEERDGEKLYSSPTPSPLPTQSSSYTALLQTDSEDLPWLYPGSSPSPMPGGDEQDLFIEETTRSPTTTGLQGGKWNSFDALFSTTQVPSHSPVSESEDEETSGFSPDTSFSTTSGYSLTLSSTAGLNSDISTKEDAPTAASTTAMPPTSTAGTAAMPPTSTAGIVAKTFRGMFMEKEVSEEASDQSTAVPPTTVEEPILKGIIPQPPSSAVEQKNPSKRDGQSTPASWLIIVAVVVAVVALLVLCVAIATRDRWNRPSQAPEKQQQQEETKANCSNQQRELEMESFLKEKPRENGHAEYTVIPLEDLPEKDPLH